VSTSHLYTIRLEGHLGATALSAFPTMAAQEDGPDTVLTGPLQDRAALFAALAQIEALGLEVEELRRVGGSGADPVVGD
jgi:hypothetical protein